VLVAASLLIITAAAAVVTGGEVERREDAGVSERSAAVTTAIDRRADIYTEKLYGARAAIAVRGRLPTRREYDDFLRAQEFQQRYPAVQVLGMLEVVDDADRASLTARVNADVDRSGLPYPGFGIRPPGRRDTYGVVTYVHPVDGNASAFGLDAYSRPNRREAAERARDTARPAAPPPDLLVQEREPNARSVLVMLPVYRGIDQTPPRERRSGAWLGVLYAGIRLPDLLRGVADTARGEDVEIRDAGRVAYDANPEMDAAAADERRTRPLTTAGRPWEVVFATREPLLSSGARAVPWLIGLLGVLVSLLAGAVVQALSSAQRRAQALAAEMTEDLRQSNQDLERFAFLASHDLQQPLRTIIGFLQLLSKQSGDRLDERGREYVDYAVRGAQQMATLIDDLLAYSRVARDRRPLEPVALDDAWRTATDQLKAIIDQSEARVSQDPLPVVLGDQGQLAQVFANLIGNAIKYRSAATPVVHASAHRVGGAYEVTVQDNGVGIDPDQRERIFEMFSRGHQEDDVEGTGVGLALARRIVERSGGSLTVRSQPGQGSCFVVRLPPASR
jgi:signal transduction histidine kinase